MNQMEQVKKYLEYCEFRKELDWNTLKAYRIDLRQFFEYTQEDIPDKDKIEEYITELHKKYMGTDNKLILENLIRLSQDGARIYIRIPTIKEVNGNEENMKETIAFLKQHDIHPAGVNLLPYHDTGSGKYAKLDMEYKGTDLHAPDKEEMEALAALFVNAGFTNTKIGG